MLYVVFQEIIPESRGCQREATFSTLLGTIFMVSLAYSVLCENEIRMFSKVASQ